MFFDRGNACRNLPLYGVWYAELLPDPVLPGVAGPEVAAATFAAVSATPPVACRLSGDCVPGDEDDDGETATLPAVGIRLCCG